MGTPRHRWPTSLEGRVDTVYASVGRKPQLLLAVHDMILGATAEPVPAEDRDYVRRVRRANTAEGKIRTYAEALADLLPRIAPLHLALRDAGARDPECRELQKSISQRRRTNMRRFAAELRDTGRMRPEVSDEHAADLVWSMNSPEYFQLLTDNGYTAHEYAELVTEIWTRTLLTPTRIEVSGATWHSPLSSSQESRRREPVQDPDSRSSLGAAITATPNTRRYGWAVPGPGTLRQGWGYAACVSRLTQRRYGGPRR